MTLAYPSAFDSIEQLKDGLHSLTAEDWNELEASLEITEGQLGRLGQRWNNRHNDLASVLGEIVKVDAGRVSAAASAFDVGAGTGGVAITFDSGVFSVAGDIAVVGQRVTDGAAAAAVAPNDGTAVEFGVHSVTTSGATIYGYQSGGGVPSSGSTIIVSWTAFQRRPGVAAPTTQILSPDSFPGLLSGYDEAKEDLPNTLAAEIEEICKAIGTSPLPTWTDIVTALTNTERALSGSVSATATDFATGVAVDVDDYFFAGFLTDTIVIARAMTDGADTATAQGNNVPLTFIGHRIQAIAGNKVRFYLRGYNKTGGDPSDSSQAAVQWIIRRSVPAPS